MAKPELKPDNVSKLRVGNREEWQDMLKQGITRQEIVEAVVKQIKDDKLKKEQ